MIMPASSAKDDSTSFVSVEQPSAVHFEFRWYHWAFLIPLAILGPAAQDCYIPNMPQMAAEFGTTNMIAGLTLQTNWLVKCVTNPSIGFMADRAGRRPVIMGSLIIFVVGSVLCAVSPSINCLLVARLFQAAGESAGSLMPSIIRDVIDEPAKRMQVQTMLGQIRPFVIFLSPCVGGIIGEFFGWRVVFWFLALWGFAVLVQVTLLLPETRHDAPALVDSAHLSRKLRRIFCVPTSFVLLIVTTTPVAASLTMLSNFAFVMEGGYGLSPLSTGCLMGSVLLGMVVGSHVVSHSQLSPFKVLRLASLGYCFTIAGCLAVVAVEHLPLWTVMPVFYSMTLCQAGVLGGGMALFMEPFGDMAGLAAGVSSSLGTGFGAVIALPATAWTQHLSARGSGISGLFAFVAATLLLQQAAFWFGFHGKARLDVRQEPRLVQQPQDTTHADRA